ncbi:hypothetical protein H0H92_015898 [Tricholoma furcatifolium]|nr:hypothetical protein H0H92_015898 [Tricholoma furcatifolium]
MATWGTLAFFNPFRLMSSLGALSLDLPDESLLLILAYGFPWHQLKSLQLSWKHFAYDFRPLVQTLQKCISLVELKIFHSTTLRMCPPEVVIPLVEDGVVAPFSLTQLLVERLPAALTRYLCHSGELQDLYTATSPITLQEFYDVLQQCNSLRKIFSIINHSTPAGAPSLKSIDILLPNLIHLTLIVDDVASYPSLLTPALRSLLVSTAQGADLVDVIGHSISRSKMQLENFSLISWPVSSSQGNLLHLLSALAPCLTVHLTGIILSHGSLESIASGCVLPHVTDLEVTVSNPVSFIDMIQKRLEKEAASGYVRSQRICGYSVEDAVDADQALLEGLAKQYGVNGMASQPSQADQKNAYARGVPGIIIHKDSLTGYGPTERSSMEGMREYPGCHQEWNNQEGRKIGDWKPKEPEDK